MPANKKSLTEQEIRTRFITPAIRDAGWDPDKNQVREEYVISAGRIRVRGNLHARAKGSRADYVLFLKPNIPLAVVEAKDNLHSVGSGMQQALRYSELLDVPFTFSSNGDGFLMRDCTGPDGAIEKQIGLDEFPSPEEFHTRWLAWKGLPAAEAAVLEQDYLYEGKEPRYYQVQAVNRVVEAVARGQDRVLLVMATGTGKTFTAFQIVWRLWKSQKAKRILYLADRNILIDQAKVNDFSPFGNAMTKITNRQVDKSFEIFLALYQAISGIEEEKKIYKQFSPDFFDMIVIDECHRGSARDDAQWREILDYFSGAVHVGMTATPKETTEISNITYFGEPVYSYSLKQGIQDGYLAPYKVVRIDLDKDLDGWRPEEDMRDDVGQLIEDRTFSRSDFDRELVIEQRTKLVAKKITEYLRGIGDRFSKTIVFCQDIDHAERMRQALVNENGDLANENRRYVMRITGDEAEGKAELDNFVDPESRYPVIATTSELMTTGVDAQTCKLVVIDQTVNSMAKFKQMIGRGTRINEEHGKFFFTIMDFRGATRLFADPEFDGDPVVIYEPGTDESPVPPDDLPGSDDGESPDGGDDPFGVGGDDAPSRGRVKYVVGGVEVTVVAERVQYMDADGRMVTESLKDFTRKTVLQEYGTLENFLRQWSDSERKKIIVDELNERGIFLEALQEDVGKDFGAFDLICHVVFDQTPLTRRQRADGVRATGYWAKYSETVRAVLDGLLDKYANEGLEPDQDAKVLRIRPFPEFGTPGEIVEEFGGKSEFRAAIKELENHLYAVPPEQKAS